MLLGQLQVTALMGWPKGLTAFTHNETILLLHVSPYKNNIVSLWV
jgi:hypothetical protein